MGNTKMEPMKRREGEPKPYLNKATEFELQSIKGISMSTSRYLVQQMPFRSWFEVTCVKGMNAKKIAILKNEFQIVPWVQITPEGASSTHAWIDGYYCEHCSCRPNDPRAIDICLSVEKFNKFVQIWV